MKSKKTKPKPQPKTNLNEPPNGGPAEAGTVKINLYKDILIPLCKAKGTDPGSMSKSEISRELAIAKRLIKTKNVSALDIVHTIEWLSEQSYTKDLSILLVSVKIDGYLEWRKQVNTVSPEPTIPPVFECTVEPIKPIDFDEWKEKREAKKLKQEKYLKASAEAYSMSKKKSLCKVHTPEEAAELLRKLYGVKSE